MTDSNVPAGNLRPRKRVSYRDTGTRPVRATLPPLTISEPKIDSTSARTSSKKPSKAGNRKKGKEKVVEMEYGSEYAEEDEQLQEAVLKQRKARARKPRKIYAKNPEANKKVEDLIALGHSEEEAYMIVEVEVCQAREAEVTKKSRANLPGVVEGIRLNDFESSTYPHPETMDLLGIRKDFELLAKNCGLLHCLTTYSDTWVRESSQFLASVTLHTYDRRVTGLQKRDGGGYILFTVNGQQFRVTLREIQEMFGFKEGEAVYPDIDREELDAIWNLMTGEPVFIPSLAKGNWIRNPTISYFRRAVAHVLFARDTTGPINKKEMEILVMALKDVLGSINGKPIVGDRGNSGMAYVLADHLTGYRNRAEGQLYRTNKKRLSIGGVIRIILEHSGIKRAYGRNNEGYVLMDLRYLIYQQMMYKNSNELNLWNRFRHPALAEAYIKLQRLSLTSLHIKPAHVNVQFLPDVLILTELATLLRSEPHLEETSDDEEPETSSMAASTSHPTKKKKTGLVKTVNKWMEIKLRRILGLAKGRDKKMDLTDQRLSDLDTRISRLASQSSNSAFRHRVPDPTPTRHSSFGLSTGVDIDPSSQPYQGAANPDDMTTTP